MRRGLRYMESLVMGADLVFLPTKKDGIPAGLQSDQALCLKAVDYGVLT